MKNTEIDHYIASSQEFAKPILNHLRSLVHQACPEAEEKLKWGFPHFDYKGVYTSMAAFKEHCALNFWKVKLMADPHGLFGEKDEKAMGQFGRIRSLKGSRGTGNTNPNRHIENHLITHFKKHLSSCHCLGLFLR